MRGLFVTGTGTGVGKTVVTAGVVRCLRAAGIDAIPMKPFQTGCLERRPDGSLEPPDLVFALRACAYSPSADEWTEMCPYRYAPACSPHLAARLAGDAPNIERVVAAANGLGDRHAWVVAEGAGGVLVPINARRTMLDLMRALNLPVLVVASGGLGTLNATLLTLSVLRAAGLRVFGVVLSDSAPVKWDLIHEDNPRTLEKLGRVRILARLPWLGRDLTRESAWRAFAAAFDPPIERWAQGTAVSS